MSFLKFPCRCFCSMSIFNQIKCASHFGETRYCFFHFLGLFSLKIPPFCYGRKFPSLISIINLALDTEIFHNEGKKSLKAELQRWRVLDRMRNERDRDLPSDVHFWNGWASHIHSEAKGLFSSRIFRELDRKWGC